MSPAFLPRSLRLSYRTIMSMRTLSLLALSVAVAAGYVAQGQLPLRAQRSASPLTMQFGTMNGPK